MIRRQEKIAVVGVNGAGKSTFLKVLAGQAEPTTGSMTLGANVYPGYFSQHAMDILDPRKTVLDTVQDAMPEAHLGTLRNLCAAFLFQGDDIYKRIENLSGGEKSRVVLATMLVQPINLLILDEPTNHLDIQSRETLLAALRNFSGTVVLVSHDRHFLRCLIDRVFEIDHGRMRTYNGHYEYYLETSGREHRAARPLFRSFLTPFPVQVVLQDLPQGPCTAATCFKIPLTYQRPSHSFRPFKNKFLSMFHQI
jgi:ATP-binding cassette subfamily F protein 3